MNSRNNSLVLRHWNCFLLSFAMDRLWLKLWVVVMISAQNWPKTAISRWHSLFKLFFAYSHVNIGYACSWPVNCNELEGGTLEAGGAKYCSQMHNSVSSSNHLGTTWPHWANHWFLTILTIILTKGRAGWGGEHFTSSSNVKQCKLSLNFMYHKKI